MEHRPLVVVVARQGRERLVYGMSGCQANWLPPSVAEYLWNPDASSLVGGSKADCPLILSLDMDERPAALALVDRFLIDL